MAFVNVHLRNKCEMFSWLSLHMKHQLNPLNYLFWRISHVKTFPSRMVHMRSLAFTRDLNFQNLLHHHNDALAWSSTLRWMYLAFGVYFLVASKSHTSSSSSSKIQIWVEWRAISSSIPKRSPLNQSCCKIVERVEFAIWFKVNIPLIERNYLISKGRMGRKPLPGLGSWPIQTWWTFPTFQAIPSLITSKDFRTAFDITE